MPSDPALNGTLRHTAFTGSLFQQHAAVHTNPWSIGTSVAVNGAILALLLCIGVTTRRLPSTITGGGMHISDFKLFAPSRGGGGGDHEPIPAIVGRLPRLSPTAIVPPTSHPLDHPLLAVAPALAVPLDFKLPDNPSLPNLGVAHSPNVTLNSDGPGGKAGIGSGDNGGVGDRNGSGTGPGDRPGVSTIYQAGVNGVSNPIAIFTPEAEFSDEARRAKYQGMCVVSVIVDAQGNPQNPRVLRPLGMGLDEKALAAVRGYRFKPARKDSHPVAVMITVAVNFRLF